MRKMLEHGDTAPLPLTQPSFPGERASSDTVVEAINRHPEATITGGISFCVTEQEVICGPITGHYSVETEDLQEPLFLLRCAQDGEVLNRDVLECVA